MMREEIIETNVKIARTVSRRALEAGNRCWSCQFGGGSAAVSSRKGSMPIPPGCGPNLIRMQKVRICPNWK